MEIIQSKFYKMKWKGKNTRRRKNGAEEIFEVIVVENFPVSLTDTTPQILKGQKIKEVKNKNKTKH